MDASMTESGEQFTLALERRLPHSPARVWRAITEREHLHQWFPAHVIGDWQVGAPLRFEFQHGEGDQLSEAELSGEVLAVETERLLEFRWGTHIIRCELIPEGEGCRLLFSETFQDPSWGARNAAGWEWCLENLDSILHGAAVAKFVMEVWQGKFHRYVKAFQARFGPQQGPPETQSTGNQQS